MGYRRRALPSGLKTRVRVSIVSFDGDVGAGGPESAAVNITLEDENLISAAAIWRTTADRLPAVEKDF